MVGDIEKRHEMMVGLEKMVDETNVQMVLELLAEICYEKAEHIQTNWNDQQLSKRWEREGDRLLVAALRAGT